MTEVRALAHAGVVDEARAPAHAGSVAAHAEPALGFVDLGHQRLHLRGVGDIDLMRRCRAVILDDGLRDLLGRPAVPVGHNPPRALAREGFGDGAADPCPTASDERDLFLKPPHLIPLSARGLPTYGEPSPAPPRGWGVSACGRPTCGESSRSSGGCGVVAA